jgi:hypothetical protein
VSRHFQFAAIILHHSPTERQCRSILARLTLPRPASRDTSSVPRIDAPVVTVLRPAFQHAKCSHALIPFLAPRGKDSRGVPVAPTTQSHPLDRVDHGILTSGVYTGNNNQLSQGLALRHTLLAGGGGIHAYSGLLHR